MFTGTLVNTAAVIIGSMLGLIFKKYIPERFNKTIISGLALCTIFIGVNGFTGCSRILLAVISVALGAIIGEALDLDGKLNAFGALVNSKFNKASEKESLSSAFINASLIFCVGSMTIVGAMQDGLEQNHTLLFTKSMLDFFSSSIFAAAMGRGVMLAAFPILVIEGGIAFSAGLAAPFLTPDVIAEMNCTGSIIIAGLGLNMLECCSLKIPNYLPAVFMPVILCPAAEFFSKFSLW